ncbi:hypothetical protein PR001_g30051, partial [Phytophthora rubi]
MKRYVIWADRQNPDSRVREINTDGGGEFWNDEIDDWYKLHGIEHARKPKSTSHLNLCERSHQTITGMQKTMMTDSGFPISFWVDAVQTAVYIKNRVFTRAIGKTPYEAMWGRQPDLHHIRRFGCLAYAHNKVGPSRKKFAPNSKVGFVLGYQEGRLGCKLYYPDTRAVGYALDARYNEDIVYKDRHAEGTAAAVAELSYVNPDIEPTTINFDRPDQAESETTERSERLEGSIENAG